MLGHIFTFLGLRGVRAEVRFADGPMEFSSDVLHRKQAAVEARAAVAALRTHTFGGEEEVAGEMHHF